ncbi:MAG: hypothetical protein GVY11_07445 [Gammaproteobacteria bacterium]|jgi:lysozyme family protein|nr:hypothetical protein [Gammaproteobacteria bacterium]
MYVPKKDLENFQKKLREHEQQAMDLDDEFRKLRAKGAAVQNANENTVAEDFPDGLGFERCLQITAKWEGGWSDHPSDPGGATQYGVTQATYRRAVREGVIEAIEGGVRNLSRQDARFIYQKFYWNDPGLANYRLPAGVDLAVFDAAVNQGPERAVRFLQRAINDTRSHVPSAALAVDGIMGPRTHEAVRALCRKGHRAELLKHFTVRRMLHWSGLRQMATFGLGWFRRGVDVLVTALDPRGNL